VFDGAVEKAYGGKRKIHWYEIFAGEKAFTKFNDWLPQARLMPRVTSTSPSRAPHNAYRGGIRSLNVALRQIMDLYSCIRPVRYYSGVPSPVKHPDQLNVIIFRENTRMFMPASSGSRGAPR